MGKNTRGFKELSKEQEYKKEAHELRHEVSKLRKQVSSLRKQLARVDLDRYSYVREMVQEHLHEDENVSNKKIMDQLKTTWVCHDCGHGHLEVQVYSKMGVPWYYRACTECDKRTESKQYHEGVQGIFKKNKDEGQI